MKKNDCWGCELNSRHAAGELTGVVYDSEHVLAHYIPDSWAPVHIRINSKQHFMGLDDLDENKREAVWMDVMRAVKLAKDEVIAKKGGATLYLNMGDKQNTKHFHCHVIWEEVDTDPEDMT